jgi:hypothetical protein
MYLPGRTEDNNKIPPSVIAAVQEETSAWHRMFEGKSVDRPQLEVKQL